MMSTFRHELPATNQALRQAIYEGAIFNIPATPVSSTLVLEVCSLLREELGDDFRNAQFVLSYDDLFERIAKLKKFVYGQEHFRNLLRQLLSELGFDTDRLAIDPLRLRCVPHLGHDHPRAKSAYKAHRDTWYANPQAQVNCWLPLHDAAAAETFTFFPAFFDKAIDNSSGEFDYDDWSTTVGFGKSHVIDNALYPSPPQGRLNPSEGTGFASLAGDLLMFAAAHLHQSNENVSGRSRFSMDFRLVDLEDQLNGLGAPNADNRSTGSAMTEYLMPASTGNTKT